MDSDSKLKDAFQKGLGLQALPPRESLQFSKTEEWDSIGHMRLVAAIEEEFAIRLDVNDVLALNSYESALAIIKKYSQHS